MQEKKKTEKNSPWWVPEKFALQIVGSLPVLLVIGKILGINRRFIKWWPKFQKNKSPLEMVRWTYLMQISVYFSVGTILSLAQLYPEKFEFAQKYKLQKKAKVDRKKLPKLFLYLNMNTLMPLYAFLYYHFVASTSARKRYEESITPLINRFLDTGRRLPSLNRIIGDSVAFMLIYEALFFASHWALHLPYFYKSIHKIHHEWSAPMALVAAYAHPIENMLSNLLPTLVFAVLCKPHVVSLNLVAIQGLIETLFEHSGFEMFSGNFHDLHHEKFKHNYGSLGILDKLCGTYRHS